MNKEIFFMPLGGGQRVGASCYYLRLGNRNILLDAGIGKENDLVFNPDFYPLLTSPFMQSMNQINEIYISHAHADHVGYLMNLMGEASRSNVYMTEITALLAEYQLYDKVSFSGSHHSEQKRLAIQSMFSRITTVSYMKHLKFENYQVQFFPAGHIPGAMMTLFQFRDRNILYTGDYSVESTALTDGCMIPSAQEIDTVIMCGLHAKHPYYVRRNGNELSQKAGEILNYVACSGRSTACQVSQLSKSIEFLKTLNTLNQAHIPIFIDDSVMKIVDKMERLSIPILNSVDNYIMGDDIPQIPHIYLSAKISPENPVLVQGHPPD